MFILPVIWLFGTSAFWVYITHSRIENVFTISILFELLVLYFFGFIKLLKIGYYLSYILIFLVLYWLYKDLKNKNTAKINDFKENYCTLGAGIFCILMIYIYFLYRYTGFTHCDEFTHWGTMVRENISFNAHYSVSTYNWLRHKDYPPFFPLLGTLWCYIGGKYSEPSLYMANMTFMFSLFMPLLSKLKKNELLKGILITITFILAGLTINATATVSDSARYYNSIYADWPMAIFTAYSFFIIYKHSLSDKFTLYHLSLNCVALVLMKQVGVPLYLLVILFALLKTIFIEKAYEKKHLLKLFIFLILIPALFYLSWKCYISITGVAANSQFKVSDVNVLDSYSILKGKAGEQWQRDAYNNFKEAIFNRVLVTTPFKMTFFMYGGLVLIISGIMIYIKKDFTLLWSMVTYAFGSVAYTMMMLFLYMFSFGSEEGPGLASFDRYMVSYLLIGTSFIIMILIDHALNSHKSTIQLACITLGTCLFIEPQDLHMLVPAASIEEVTYKVGVFSKNKDEMTFNREDVNGLTLSYDLYYVTGNDIEIGNQSYAYDELDDLVRNYDYIYILEANETFSEKWKENYGFDLTEYNLYYIADKGETITFTNSSFGYMDYITNYYITNYDPDEDKK